MAILSKTGPIYPKSYLITLLIEGPGLTLPDLAKILCLLMVAGELLLLSHHEECSIFNIKP